MRKKFALNVTCLFVICTIIAFNMLAVLAVDVVEPAQTGMLDYDAPLSYIDRQPYYESNSQQNQEKFDQTNQYVQQQKAQQEMRRQQALKDIDVAIQQVTQFKQQYDDSRKSYNYNYYDPYYMNSSQFTTEIEKPRYHYYDHQQPYYHHNYNNYYSYQPYINIFNIPGYMGNTESSYDGIDNDSDDFIDEGFHHGNVQIILGDSGANKDDEWSLYLDGKYIGMNNYGKIRTWDLNLYPGSHEVTIVATKIPDDSGTYTIIFRNANVISGPPLAGENMRQGQSFKWLINVK